MQENNQRLLSDFNEYLRLLIEIAEKREEEHRQYQGELEQRIEVLHSLFNDLGEVAIGFHDQLMESIKVADSWFVGEYSGQINALYKRYTEIVGKRNEMLLNRKARK